MARIYITGLPTDLKAELAKLRSRSSDLTLVLSDKAVILRQGKNGELTCGGTKERDSLLRLVCESGICKLMIYHSDLVRYQERSSKHFQADEHLHKLQQQLPDEDACGRMLVLDALLPNLEESSCDEDTMPRKRRNPSRKARPPLDDAARFRQAVTELTLHGELGPSHLARLVATTDRLMAAFPSLQSLAVSDDSEYMQPVHSFDNALENDAFFFDEDLLEGMPHLVRLRVPDSTCLSRIPAMGWCGGRKLDVLTVGNTSETGILPLAPLCHVLRTGWLFEPRAKGVLGTTRLSVFGCYDCDVGMPNCINMFEWATDDEWAEAIMGMLDPAEMPRMTLVLGLGRGTLRILRAAAARGSLLRVVLRSSSSAGRPDVSMVAACVDAMRCAHLDLGGLDESRTFFDAVRAKATNHWPRLVY